MMGSIGNPIGLFIQRKAGQEELHSSEAGMRQLLSLMPAAVYTCDAEGRIAFFNQRAAELWGREPELGKDDEKFCGSLRLWLPDGSPLPRDQTPMARAVMEGASTRNHEVTLERPDGKRLTVSVNIDPLYDGNGLRCGAINVFEDVTERKLTETLMAIQKEAFEMAASGRPLLEVLQFLTRSAESLSRPGAIAAIHVLDEAGLRFAQTSAPSLPAEYAQRMVGMEVGSRASPCCAAVMSRRPVVVGDIAASAEFPAFRTFALPLGIRACWSTPILSSNGKMLGTFANYYREAQEPSSMDNLPGEVVSRTAGAIIEGKRAEAAMQRLAAIVESSDDAIISKDLNGVIRSWNQGAERLFGYAAEEVIGQPVTVLMPPERLNEEPGILARIRRGEPIEHYETVRRTKDGRLLDVSLTVSPVRNERGEVIGASKIARDITGGKLAQQALLESEERFRTLADNISQLAWSATELGVATWYNRRWYEYTGATLEQMKGRGWETVHHPDHLPRVKAKLEESLKRGDEWEDTFPLRGKDGQYRWFLSRAVPVRGADGKIKSWFGTNTDITELLETREELAKSHRDLETRVQERTASLQQAISHMEEFSYTVSHDLRAPARAMKGYARIVLDDFGQNLEPQAKEYLERIIRGGTRMDTLIQDVLTYSRLSRRELELLPVSLDKVVTDIVQQFPELQPPRAKTTVHTPLLRVVAHESSLAQAISNLLINAAKFVPAAEIPQITVRTESRGAMVRLWVEDNGIGIKPDQHHRIFGVFERIPTNPQMDGTGIGLAIVRKAVEKMGGAVGLESDGLTGSRFWIELPGVPAYADRD